jgi:hypothetical protein
MTPSASAAEAVGIDRTKARQLADIIRDPVRFARRVLQHDPWSTAEKILHSVANNRRTAVKACHSSSKTFTAAEAVLWWTIRYSNGIAITTAPTFTQVERLLWGEMRVAAEKSRIALPKLNKTELPLSAANYALGLSTNEGVRFQGFHGKLLIVLDEAPGVLAEIYDAIEGMRAGGDVHVLLLGNPIFPAGPFYAAFTTEAASWERFTISALDTPNLRGLYIVDPRDGSRIGDADGRDLMTLNADELDENVRPYLVTRRWVAEKYVEWGVGHPKFDARALGKFPDQSEFSLVPLAWIEDAELMQLEGEGAEVEAGIDVAGPGKNETVLVVRRGPNVIFAKGYAQADPRGAVARDLMQFQGQKRKTADGRRSVWSIKLKIDVIGIGYNFARHFEDLAYEVIDVNVGDPARDQEKFRNLKAELYWGLRERFEHRRVGGIIYPKMVQQLASIEYFETSSGLTQIESKDDRKAKKRGIDVDSLDWAEALILAFAPPPRRFVRDLSDEAWDLDVNTADDDDE